MPFDPVKARQYVTAIDLSGTPRRIVEQGPGETAGEVFEQARDQAQVVGSGLFSFAKGVTPQVREAISDSALLAQLVANKQVAADQDPIGWFRVYSEVLTHLGWTLQDDNWADYTTRGTAAEVHEKIMEVAAVALGATPAALAIIAAAVKALKGMNPDSSWLKIFNRESQKARIARFQVGLVNEDPQGNVFVALLGCLIEANDTITQVLIFKFRDARARFQGRSSKVSLNATALADLGPVIRSKTRAYQADYLSTILSVEPAAGPALANAGTISVG
jgi:hypothetical protein